MIKYWLSMEITTAPLSVPETILNRALFLTTDGIPEQQDWKIIYMAAAPFFCSIITTYKNNMDEE